MMEHTKSDLKRQHILDAGRALILQHGFEGVGIARILSDCKVPKGSFYYYFPSKDAFGQALLTDYVSDYIERLDQLVATDGTARDKLDRFWSAWLTQSGSEGIASQCLVVKLGAEVADLSEPMRTILNDGITTFTQRIAQLLQAGVADGSLAPNDDPQATAQTLYAHWLGAAILAKLSRSQDPLRLAMAHTRTLLSPPKP